MNIGVGGVLFVIGVALAFALSPEASADLRLLGYLFMVVGATFVIIDRLELRKERTSENSDVTGEDAAANVVEQSTVAKSDSANI